MASSDRFSCNCENSTTLMYNRESPPMVDPAHILPSIADEPLFSQARDDLNLRRCVSHVFSHSVNEVSVCNVCENGATCVTRRVWK